MLGVLRWIGRRQWIPYGLRDRFIRFFVDPDREQSFPVTVDFFGHRYGGNLASYIDWVVFFFGAYEKEVLDFLADAARCLDCDVFVDVGANVGQHTLFMSQRARKVVAFEPFGTVRREILQKVQDNALRNIVVHPVGLAEREGEAPFYAPRSGNAGAGTFHHERGRAVGMPIGKLPTARGDTLLQDAGRIDLIKIDVEGCEPNVIAGLSKTIARHRPVLVIEFSAETRTGFVDRARMIAAVGGGRLLALRPTRSGYALGSFDFDRFEGYVVAIPNEKAAMLGLAGPRRERPAVPA
jgi:FkbM family methyltransferase